MFEMKANKLLKRGAPCLQGPLSNEKGLTLIEVMITMVVVIVALVGYVGANTAIQQRGEANFERAVALQDANQVIEQMRQASGTGQFPANVTAAFPEGQAAGGFNSLQNEQVVVNYADAAANPLVVTVTVTWLENGRTQVSRALRTILTQRTT